MKRIHINIDKNVHFGLHLKEICDKKYRIPTQIIITKLLFLEE